MFDSDSDITYMDILRHC